VNFGRMARSQRSQLLNQSAGQTPAPASFYLRMGAMRTLLLSLLALLLPYATVAASTGPTPVEGEDYVVIEGGQPYRPLAGTVEVVEVFGYWCPHCHDFQAQLEAWQRKLPAGVRFTYVPAVFDEGDAFARGFFAAEGAGAVAKTHDAVYRAVHVDGVLARNATVDEVAWFYGQQGLDAAKTRAAMLSPATDAKLRAAHDFALRSGVEGTPTLIINGRYRITAHTHEDGLRIADQLIAQLRGRH
jgi:thiol:disulfide interchange protein DsbA